MLATEPSNAGRKPKPRPSVRSKNPVLGHILQISIARVPHVLKHTNAAAHPRTAHKRTRTHMRCEPALCGSIILPRLTGAKAMPTSRTPSAPCPWRWPSPPYVIHHHSHWHVASPTHAHEFPARPPALRAGFRLSAVPLCSNGPSPVLVRALLPHACLPLSSLAGPILQSPIRGSSHGAATRPAGVKRRGRAGSVNSATRPARAETPDKKRGKLCYTLSIPIQLISATLAEMRLKRKLMGKIN